MSDEIWDWRKSVEGVEPTNICPTCNEPAPFGAVFFVGVEGMVQECRSCRSKRYEIDTSIVLSANDFKQLQDAIDAPPQANQKLRDLLKLNSVFAPLGKNKNK